MMFRMIVIMFMFRVTHIHSYSAEYTVKTVFEFYIVDEILMIQHVLLHSTHMDAELDQHPQYHNHPFILTFNKCFILFIDT